MVSSIGSSLHGSSGKSANSVSSYNSDSKLDLPKEKSVHESGKGFMDSNSGNNGQSSGGGSGEGASGSVADKGLQSHNMFRKIHNAPPMKLDNQMSKEAEEYAKKLADMGTLQHSSRDGRKGAGENLAMGCSSNKAMTVEEAVKNWLVVFLQLGFRVRCDVFVFEEC